MDILLITSTVLSSYPATIRQIESSETSCRRKIILVTTTLVFVFGFERYCSAMGFRPDFRHIAYWWKGLAKKWVQDQDKGNEVAETKCLIKHVSKYIIANKHNGTMSPVSPGNYHLIRSLSVCWSVCVCLCVCVSKITDRTKGPIGNIL